MAETFVAVRRGPRGFEQKVCIKRVLPAYAEDSEFIEEALGDKPKTFTTIVEDAQEKLTMCRRTAINYLNRLTEAGLIATGGGLYWRKGKEEVQECNTP